MPITKPSLNSSDVVYQITEEQSLKATYISSDARLRWFYYAINSFKDFGLKISTVARSVINNQRMEQKGTVTNVEATAGFNIDVQNNMHFQRLLQAFMFTNADPRTLSGGIEVNALDNTTQFMSLPAATVPGLTGSFGANVSTGFYGVGTLLFFNHWNTPGNNGLHKVTTATTIGGLTAVSPALTAEANSSNQQTVRVVGFEFASGDIAMTLPGDLVQLTSTALAFANLNPRVGEWLYVGGDAVGTLFTSGGFWGRVSYVDSAHGYIQMDMTTGTQVASTGTGLTIRIFGGNNYRNGAVRRSFTQSRIYANYQETLSGITTSYANAEHTVGSIPNDMTLNIKQKSKMDVDFTFVAMDGLQDGKNVVSGVPYTSGTFVPESTEDPFNTAQAVYMMRLSILDPVNLDPTPYFAYATDCKIDIKNNVTPNDAIGVIGAFDANTGNFDISAAVTAYFASVHSITALRNNASVGLQIISAMQNGGFVIDIPVMTISGGMPTVDANKPVMIDLNMMGYKGPNNYALGVMFFEYLPNVAMPS